MCGGGWRIARALAGRRVAGAHRRADRRVAEAELARARARIPASGACEVLLDVVRQRLQRRDVEDRASRRARPPAPGRSRPGVDAPRGTRRASCPSPVGAAISVLRAGADRRPGLGCASVGAAKVAAEPAGDGGVEGLGEHGPSIYQKSWVYVQYRLFYVRLGSSFSRIGRLGGHGQDLPHQPTALSAGFGELESGCNRAAHEIATAPGVPAPSRPSSPSRSSTRSRRSARSRRPPRAAARRRRARHVLDARRLGHEEPATRAITVGFVRVAGRAAMTPAASATVARLSRCARGTL